MRTFQFLSAIAIASSASGTALNKRLCATPQNLDLRKVNFVAKYLRAYQELVLSQGGSPFWKMPLPDANNCGKWKVTSKGRTWVLAKLVGNEPAGVLFSDIAATIDEALTSIVEKARTLAHRELAEADGLVYGSDAMARVLSLLNIPYIALVPGSSFRGLHDSIVNFNANRNPEIITCLHEEHSVAIAHGFAKITERTMAAIVHDAVGLMHGTMAVYNAHCDRMPVLLLGGNGPLDATRRRMWIDWIHTTSDGGALIRPYVKFDDQPASVQAAVNSILTATAAASQIPRGPAFVCLDVALQEDKLPNPVVIHFPSTERYFQAAKNPPGPSQEDVIKVRNALLQARRQRHLFLFGRVNRSQESWNERIKLAERYDARVLTDLKLSAAFPTRHRLHAAPPNLFLNQEEINGIRAADVIVAFDWVDLAGTLKRAFPENDGLGEAPESITIINVTLDFPAIHNGWTKDHFAQPSVDIAVLADVDKTVSALLAAAPKPKHHTIPTDPWWPTPSQPPPLLKPPPQPQAPKT
ncbi:hypothetical protein N0V88_005170 [Collariella sp. IMI 366227]|nr:hypothetical protein N0V88_005170 [Collariella sp. IMI 366227]